MRLMTLAEQFADLVAGKYTGSSGILWQTLGRCWNAEDVIEVTEDSRRVEMPDGSLDLTPCLWEAIEEALSARDHARMLVLADLAEERGVNPELCDLTRRALRVQYAA